jgi:hypothetical protein
MAWNHPTGMSVSALRVIIISIVSGGLLWLLLGTLLRGFRTGKMRYLDSSSVCNRLTQPLLFWFLVLFYVSLSIIISIVWCQSVLS